jgi:hypothetical protein
VGVYQIETAKHCQSPLPTRAKIRKQFGKEKIIGLAVLEVWNYFRQFFHPPCRAILTSGFLGKRG